MSEELICSKVVSTGNTFYVQKTLIRPSLEKTLRYVKRPVGDELINWTELY